MPHVVVRITTRVIINVVLAGLRQRGKFLLRVCFVLGSGGLVSRINRKRRRFVERITHTYDGLEDIGARKCAPLSNGCSPIVTDNGGHSLVAEGPCEPNDVSDAIHR